MYFNVLNQLENQHFPGNHKYPSSVGNYRLGNCGLSILIQAVHYKVKTFSVAKDFVL